MRTFLSIICIISASITAGNCVVCVEGSSNNGLDYVGELVTCGTCITTITERTNGAGNRTYSVRKTCALDLEICNLTYSSTTDRFHLNYMSLCCDTDLCNNKTVQASPGNKTENGIECPSCHVTNAGSCAANGTVRCTGSESKCLQVTEKVLQKGTCLSDVFQGCVTENVCGLTRIIPMNPEAEMCGNRTLTCTAGNSTAPLP